MRKSLRLRIFLSIIITISVIYTFAIASILSQVQRMFTDNLTQHTHQLIKSSGKYFNSVFSKDIEILRALTNTLTAISDENYNDLISQQDKIIPSILSEAPQFLSIGISWEIAAIDSTYHKNHGRYRYLYYWNNGKITQRRDTVDINDAGIGTLYYLFKISKQTDITDIYYDSYTGRDEDKQLMASIGIPILFHDQFAGLIACDISLDRFDKIVQSIKPVPEAHTFLISHSGNIVANSTGEYINEPLTKILSYDVARKNILSTLSEGKHIMFVQTDTLGQKNLVMLEPFYFGNINRAWGIGVIVPLKIIQSDSSQIIRTALGVAFVGFLIMVIVLILVINAIIKPLNAAVESLDKLSKFDISNANKLKVTTTGELGRIANSINRLIDSLADIRNFTFEISQGNLNVTYTKHGDKDILGQALIEMQRNLKIAKIEAEKREEEEKLQRWAIEGEAKIAEILRENAQDLEELNYQVVSYLVHYTGAAQGAMFYVDSENKEIELVAAYAYERRKFLQKKIPFGVGLIGRSVVEGETIYITDIPKGYSSITSGLGQEEPRSLLIVPFKFNEIIYAVVELNSFKDFKPHIRHFIEKIGISIASTIANMQITVKTNKLVKELQGRSQELTMQEEEMRQNLEEMQTTQEELRRKVSEYENIVNALNQVSFVVEYNMERQIININNKFLQFLGKTRDEMLGTEQGAFIDEEQQREKLNNLWHNIEMGRISMFTQKTNIDGKIIWFAEAYIPIFDDNGKPYKVINIANDITNLMEIKQK